jgi:hypothetical protein
VGRRHERDQFFAFALRHFGRLPVLLRQPASALSLLGGCSQLAFLNKYQAAKATPSSPTGPMTGMARIAPANANRNNLQTSFISGLRQPEGVWRLHFFGALGTSINLFVVCSAPAITPSTCGMAHGTDRMDS